MTILEMLGESGKLTLLGMGIVFSFLILMIIAVNFTGKIIHSLGLDKDNGTKTVPAASKPKDGAVTAAISAAVNQYKKN